MKANYFVVYLPTGRALKDKAGDVVTVSASSERGAKSAATRKLYFVDWNLHAVYLVADEAKPAPAAPVTVDPVASPAAASHYFASTAVSWATGATRNEAIAKAARIAGADFIKRNVKANGGLYCWSCKVGVSLATSYDIESYAPAGVPKSEAKECEIQTVKGAYTMREKIAN